MPRRLLNGSPRQTPPVEVIRLKIANRLKTVLKEKNLSQVDCAKRIAVSPRQFNRIVAGDLPRLDVAYLLEAALETPLHEIFVPATKIVTVR